MDTRTHNPFYKNYLFSKDDIDRRPLSFSEKLRMIFSPMYSQMNDGYIFYFKIASGGAIYLFSYQDDDL